MLRYLGRILLVLVPGCFLLIFGARLLGAVVPAGTQLAYAVRYSETAADMFVVDLARGLTAPLIKGVFDRAISFAPDGTLVFSRYVDRDRNLIFVMDSGGSITQLSPDGARDEYPVWSSDGTQIAFLSFEEGSSQQALYAMNRDGSERRNLSQRILPSNIYPVWLPDSLRLMYGYVGVEQSATFLVNSLTGDMLNFTYTTGIRALPAWSPDGRYIAYVLYSSLYASIYVAEVNADGSVIHGTIEELNNSSRAYNTFPRWSPDSRRLVYISDVNGTPEIFAMNMDGSQNVNLSQNSQSSDTFPVWSPDGTQIAFISNREGVAQVYVMNADGSNQRQVTQYRGAGQVGTPTWLP